MNGKDRRRRWHGICKENRREEEGDRMVHLLIPEKSSKNKCPDCGRPHDGLWLLCAACESQIAAWNAELIVGFEGSD